MVEMTTTAVPAPTTCPEEEKEHHTLQVTWWAVRSRIAQRLCWEYARGALTYPEYQAELEALGDYVEGE